MAAKNLYEALLAAQKEMPDLQRNAINPHFKSKFISLDSLLDQVLPVLNNHGLILTQMPTTVLVKKMGVDVVAEAALRTTLIFAADGTSIEDIMLLCMAKDDPQGQGSAITYARRYSLMALLGLQADQDDDGSAATAGAGSRRTAAKATKKAEVVNPAKAQVRQVADQAGVVI